jgi:hypothetical protein
MKPFLILTAIFLVGFFKVHAGRISGTVTDEKGGILPFASIVIKGTTRGTTANNEGKYFIITDAGKYTIICQYVGYERQEKTIEVSDTDIQVDFRLSLQELSMAAVVIKPGAEDPAYEIIRQAIRKRTYYLNQLDKFQCEVYIKGQLRLRNFPKKFFGQKVDFEDGDTSKKKIIFLSETVAKYSVNKPNKAKIEVLSTKVSGQSDGYGFSAPQIVSFYENNIQIGGNLNARGFISPIANNALNFYRYKLEGVFIEDGKEVNKIKVIPKRKFEPLFSGYINITENDWRIHSVQLQLTKESQMELVDTLRIEQLHMPYQKDIWVIRSQVIYPSIKIFGFDAHGSFVNLYSKFEINPEFAKKHFNSTLLKFYEGSNKKPADYWDSIRPVPLQTDEIVDYRKKDSLEQARKDPKYLDSLDRRRNRVSVMSLLVSGQNFSREKKRESYSISPLLRIVSYNTVEGLVLNFRGSYTKRLDSSTRSRRSITISPVIRYGFSNQHLNAYSGFTYNYGRKYLSSVNFNAGKRVYQFNNANPILALDNSIATLFWERNYMKLYEAWFGRLGFVNGIGEGATVSGSVSYQDRIPLENTTDYVINDSKEKAFTPNHPEIMTSNFQRHQALAITIGLQWRPGGRYIEYPDRKINIGSKYPTFNLLYTHGIKNLFGSDIDYSKWYLGVHDNINLRLWGSARYALGAGGFFRRKMVEMPDYTHFNGNQLFLANDYLNSFQLLPYYKYSNVERFYAKAHVEHHFNGLLTNKIPLFRRLNWHLVTGANSVYLSKDQYYIEPFVGLENVFKILRIDFLWGIEKGQPSSTGIRLGLRGMGRGDNDRD